MAATIDNLADSFESKDWTIADDQSLRFWGQLWIPSDSELREEILQDAHRYRYSIYLGGTKMRQSVKRNYW